MELPILFSILMTLLAQSSATSFSPTSPLQGRSVTCLTVDSSATATWTNEAGETCTFVGVVGSNFGETASGGDYSCNGRCGTGCTGAAIGNVYTQDCFSHDMCSYFNNATGGASDPNCGSAYEAAEDDYLLGYVDGCSQTNPSSAAAAPTTSPTCA